MTGFGFDPYDAEWEHPDTGRTVWLGRDDYCDVCDGEIDEHDHCDCPEDLWEAPMMSTYADEGMAA